MTGNANLILNYALVCDDIRREDTGKLILIGVYGRDIRSKMAPTNLILSLAISATATKPIQEQFEIRWMTDGNVHGQVNGALTVERPGATLMSVTGLIVSDIKTDVDLNFEWSVSGAPWEKICSIPIVIEQKAA